MNHPLSLVAISELSTFSMELKGELKLFLYQCFWLSFDLPTYLFVSQSYSLPIELIAGVYTIIWKGAQLEGAWYSIQKERDFNFLSDKVL